MTTLVAGQVCVGYIASVSAVGVFVRFGGEVTGLAPFASGGSGKGKGKGGAGTGPSPTPPSFGAVGDTVLCVVDRVTLDEGKGRFTVKVLTPTLPVSDSYPALLTHSLQAPSPSSSTPFSLAALFLRERVLCGELAEVGLLKPSGEEEEEEKGKQEDPASLPTRASFPPGAKVTATVQSVTAKGVFFNLPVAKGAVKGGSTAAAMGTIGTTFKPTQIWGVGDNFYEDGITCSGDNSRGCTADANSHRFLDTFENVYTAPSLMVPWWFNGGNRELPLAPLQRAALLQLLSPPCALPHHT
jgi:hypothetical protein